MTGFIKGLFNKKGGAATDTPSDTQQQLGSIVSGVKKAVFSGEKAPTATKATSGDAFFLSPDDAKTFGNIDYMKSSNTIEHTFPKGKPQVSQVSSSNYRKIKAGAVSSGPSFTTKPQTSFAAKTSVATSSTTTTSTVSSSSSQSESEKRRPADSSMDMFRNMAKSIRKG